MLKNLADRDIFIAEWRKAYAAGIREFPVLRDLSMGRVEAARILEEFENAGKAKRS